MTVEKTKDCIAIMQAYVDGKEVESNKGITFTGFNGLTPTWDWDNDCKNYAIKREMVSFIAFLKENNAYDDYVENTEIRHQRWDYIDKYTKYEDIVKFAPEHWLCLAFDWSNSPSDINWEILSARWEEVTIHKEVVW